MSVARGLPPQAAAYLLQGLAGDALVTEALRLLGDGAIAVAEVIADALERQPASLREVAAGKLAADERAPARYVRARLAAASGALDEAVSDLDRAAERLPGPDLGLLSLRARWQVRRADFAAAARDVAAAIALRPPYAFYVRAERLVEKIRASGAWTAKRRCRVALLGTSTTSLLAPVLSMACFASGIDAEIYEAPFGNLRQEILDPASGLYRFAPDAAVILVNHTDLALPPSDAEGRALAFARELRDLWTTLKARCPCHVVQTAIDTPWGGAWGALEDTLGGRRRAVAQANLALSEDLPAGVSILNLEALVAAPGGPLFSESEWHASRQYPSFAALPTAAGGIAAHLGASLGLGRKVLVVDLDNTLWGGVIGEDGLGGIRIGPPSAEGEGFLALQHHLKELARRGVLLAVCSKNNQADAESPFRSHDAMALRLEDFAAFRANWEDKASNLSSIAAELSLGLDSFVFLDDNPLERAWVTSRLPMVAVPHPGGGSPWEMREALRRGLYFEATTLTREDLERNRSYQATAALKSAEQSGASVEDFLAGLDLVVDTGPVDDKTVERVTQLINKTNQFNLTTRRYTTDQVRSLATSSDHWCRWFRLSDRFADHGLVGAMIAKRGAEVWTIETFLMSCRVLGRKMEDFMCAAVIEAAADAGAHEVVGEYLATEKNGLVRDLYARMGFSGPDAGGAYHFDPRSDVRPRAPWIRERDMERQL